MITYKDWYIFLALVSFWLPTSVWGFSFELNKSSIQIGDTAVLSIILPNSDRAERPLIQDELLLSHPELKILERNTSEKDNQLIITFEVTAYQAKNYRIPPVQIKWGPDTFSTEALDLTVTTTRPPDDTQIRPEFGEITPPFPWRKAYLLVLGVLGSLMLLWLLKWMALRIPWKRLMRFSWQIRMPKLETDRMWLRKEIAQLRIQVKEGNSSPELIDRIIFTLKIFLNRRTLFPAPALTSKELEASLPKKYLEKHLKPVFLTSDKFKYQSIQKEDVPRLADELLTQIEKEFL